MSRFHSRRKLRTALMLLGILVVLSVRVSAQPAESFQQAWRSGVPFEVSGVVRVTYADDFQNHRAEVIHTIRDERTGHEFRLRFEHEPPALQSGRRVTLHGRTRGSEIYLNGQEGSEVVVLALDPSAPLQASAGSTSQASAVTGDQSTLVIVANFRDKGLDPLVPGADCSMQAISDRVFTDPQSQSVDGLYRSISSGQVSFSGRVVGPVTLNASSTDACNNNVWAAAADSLAAAIGVDPAQYARRVYVMPSSTCPAAGLADLGVTPSRAWVFTCDRPHVYAHELGHNLGMQHASTETSEYGDNSDVMGMQGGLLPVNAPHKSQMGWLPESQSVEITQSGTYDVAPLPLDPAAAASPQALKVRKPDTNEYYYVSYRHGSGFESNACCAYLDRLSIHRWAGGNSKTVLLAALQDGESYTDPVTNFSVTQVNHGETSAVAQIVVGSSCGSSTPFVTLSPRDQSGSPGAHISYDIALSNNDSPACAPSTFSLTQAVPLGWTSSVTPSSLVLTPGVVGKAVLVVGSPASAVSGTQAIGVTATDANVAAHSSSTNGSYSVVRACTNTPSLILAPSSQAASPGSRADYSFSVVNRDDAGCPATTFNIAPAVPSGWTPALSPSTLNLAAGASATVGYSVTSAAGSSAGAYSVSANLADSAGRHGASATASYIVDTRDVMAPSAPVGLVAASKRGQVTLSWQPSIDNLGVVGYRMSRNGTLVGLVTGTSWGDQLAPSGTNTYFVAAYDAAGNVSANSNAVTVSSGMSKRSK